MRKTHMMFAFIAAAVAAWALQSVPVQAEFDCWDLLDGSWQGAIDYWICVSGGPS